MIATITNEYQKWCGRRMFCVRYYDKKGQFITQDIWINEKAAISFVRTMGAMLVP